MLALEPDRTVDIPTPLLSLDRIPERVETDLEVWYQPICDLETRLPRGAEALARSRHPKKGILLPVEFLPFADHDAMAALDLEILESVLREARRLTRQSGLPDLFTLQVNLCAKNLESERFLLSLLQLLEHYRIPPPALVFEIAEYPPLDLTRAGPLVETLREWGCRFSLDDFGTGYSNLDYLTRLPVEQIKLDQSLVAGLGRSPRALTVVRQILSLAGALDAQVVAEGIETSEQMRILRDLGCTEGQGFLLGRPAPALIL